MGFLDKFKPTKKDVLLTGASLMAGATTANATIDKQPSLKTETPPTIEHKDTSPDTPSKQSQKETIVEPKTGKKFIIPKGYKAEITPNGRLSFIPKTGTDYEKEGVPVLYPRKKKYKMPNKQTYQESPPSSPEQKNTPFKTPSANEQKTTPPGYKMDSDGTFILDVGKKENTDEPKKTPDQETNSSKLNTLDLETGKITSSETTPPEEIIADVNSGKSLSPGADPMTGKDIHWGNLKATNKQSNQTPTFAYPPKSNQILPKEETLEYEKLPKNPIPKGTTLRFSQNQYANTNPYDKHDDTISYDDLNIPSPPSEFEMKTPDKKEGQLQKISPETPTKTPNKKEQSPKKQEETKPEPVDSTGPTMIASQDTPPKANQEQLDSPSREQLKEEIDGILSKIPTKRLVAIPFLLSLLSGNVDEAIAQNLPTNLSQAPDKTTLQNTQEAKIQIVNDAYLKFLREQEKLMFSKHPLTRQQFINEYNIQHPNNKITMDSLGAAAQRFSHISKQSGKINLSSGRNSSGQQSKKYLEGIPTVQTRLQKSLGSINTSYKLHTNNSTGFSREQQKQKKAYTINQFGGRNYSSKNGSVEIGPGNYDGGISISPE